MEKQVPGGKFHQKVQKKETKVQPPRKREHAPVKTELHPRNKHKERYNFGQLIESFPELAPFVSMNCYNDLSVDFFNPEAVKMLNKALLLRYYGIDHWDIPPTYLCPPIPGRADYIHHIADLLGSVFNGKIPTGNRIKCLDIGVGANCIYPIIGVKEYEWNFVGSDIDKLAIKTANKIIESNPSLDGKIELRIQPNLNRFFDGIIQEGERFDLTTCNPPFHASMEEAQLATLRKLSNLKQRRITEPTLNFGGQSLELWCKGGEERFVNDLIFESRRFKNSCFWFSTLISKESNLKGVYATLKRLNIPEVKTIHMGQGNKTSRIVAWSFLSSDKQKEWIDTYW
jgi:23S rRNA (adenine1618-N6)-methyltransferase